jgi:hypothetical protein
MSENPAEILFSTGEPKIIVPATEEDFHEAGLERCDRSARCGDVVVDWIGGWLASKTRIEERQQLG